MTETPADTPATPQPWELPVPPHRRRRRILIAIGAALVVVAVVVGGWFALGLVNAHAAVKYTSAAEHYSVTAPGKPTVKKLKVEELVPLTSTHWTDGDRYYSVVSGPAGPPSIQGIFLGGALETALKNAPGVTASRVTSDVLDETFSGEPQQITLSGEPALETTATVTGAPAFFHVIFTGHGGLLYLIIFSDSPDHSDTDFLHSFKFVG